MPKTIYPPTTKDHVKQLLLDQKSYKEITDITGVPKSTISIWFGKTIDRPWTKKAQLEHLAAIRKMARISLQKKWNALREEQEKFIRTKLQKELPTYPFENIGFHKSLLAMLYWAEGAKHKGASGPNFVNTDPELMLLYVTLLRKCYDIDETKLKARIHIHHYHSPLKVKKFWSKKLNIPVEQFGKIYVKKRSMTRKFRKNFAGICFVYYGNSMIRKEIMELAFSLGRTVK
jgi:hypothetical protein